MASRHSPARRIVFLVGMLLVFGTLSQSHLGAVGATPILDEPGLVALTGAPPSCSGHDDPFAALQYGIDEQSDVSISCAPAGSTVTSVEVVVEFDHDCTVDLNVRLDHLPRTTFLQQRDCEASGDDYTLRSQRATSMGLVPMALGLSA